MIPEAALPTSEKRRYLRRECPIEATLNVGRWPHYRSVKGRIRDVSIHGVRFELDSALPLPSDQQITMRWKIPPALGLAARSDTYASEGVLVWTARKAGAPTCGIRFRQPIDEQVEEEGYRVQKVLVALLAALLAVAIAVFKIHNILAFWYEPFLQGYSIAAAGFVLSRFLISSFYREPEDRGYLPNVSLIIAAKNEEAHIAETIHCCFQSRYPADRMEVLVIDDGSTDKTWEVIQSLQVQYTQLRAFRFEKNKGKRFAMGLGAQKAHGDVLVYVDSDSYVSPEGIYRIVQPFAEPSVGAVSGHVLVALEADNFISKMESVRYYIAHRVMKAAEGVFGAVTCCPGAFSAYRRSAVLDVLSPWLNQTFLGTRATFGDDRSLTNYILRRYQVLYHAGARAVTYVPRTWSQFFRQQLRWKKSWMRETTVATRILIRKHPVAAISYYVGVALTLLSPLVALRAILILPILFGSTSYITYLTGLFLMYTFLCLLCLYYTRSRYWYYGLAFAALYISVLAFQNYYALLTVRKNHWGTR